MSKNLSSFITLPFTLKTLTFLFKCHFPLLFSFFFIRLSLRRETATSSNQLSSSEIERLVENYDTSMLFTARDTTSRMESVIFKLRSFIEDLKKLQNDWQTFNSDVESFRKWLDRKTRTNGRNYRPSSIEVGFQFLFNFCF